MDQKTLCQLLRYEPETGHFYWLHSGTGRNLDRAAGDKKQIGYIYIGIDRRRYLAHRLAWLYVTGEWPKEQIDHINGVRDDNRFCNLREATQAENLRNKNVPSKSRSGFKGVTFEKRLQRWQARIVVNRRSKHLGTFDTPQQAHEAYCEAAKKYHGEFASF